MGRGASACAPGSSSTGWATMSVPAPLMAYVFPCPHCRRGPITLDHSDLRPVREQLLGTEWQCSHCEGWAWIRVAMPDRELMVEKSAAPATREARSCMSGPRSLGNLLKAVPCGDD
jgi:hypothetical protein